MPKDPRNPRRSFDDIVHGAATPARRTPQGGPTRRSARAASGAGASRAAAPSGRGGGAAGRGGRGGGSGGGRNGSGRRFWNYPRRDKGPIGRWLPSWRFVLGSVLSLGIAAIALFFIAYFTLEMPEPEDMATAQSTTVYYADGETEMGQFAEVRRTIIDTSELPEHVGHAIVASEDRRFYSNVGVDPIGIVRAFINNVSGGPRQGGSTITQQYVERYYTGNYVTYTGKAKEAILALKIDRQLSKDQILGNYMNTIYFGRGSNGIEQGAQAFFDKPAAELSVSEAALLAGIIPAPSNLDPAVNPDRAEQRWNRTLDLMVESGFLSAEERAEQVFPEVIDPGRQDMYAGPQGYLLKTVHEELSAQADLDEGAIATGGYKVVTTIDPAMQEAAVEAAENLPEDRSPNLRVGLVSLDNATGAIRAMYGGEDYLDNFLNAATQARAQGGSTFKVFTLAAALEQGINLAQTFPSYSPMQITPDWAPVNFDGRGRGPINLVTATQQSVNTTYAHVNDLIGPENTREMAVRLGLPEDTTDLMDNPSNVLGTASPTVLDNAHAFSTIANGGVRTTPHIVDSVTSPTGATTYTAPRTDERVLDAQVAADATYAMTKVVEGGTGARAAALGRPAAGKTGSSSDYKSAWFVGFVPQITTAVAMFQPSEDGQGQETISPVGGVSPVHGGSWPAAIWTEFMIAAVGDLPVENFPPASTPPPPAPAPTETEEPEEEEDEEPEEEGEEPEPEETEPEPEPTETDPAPVDPSPEPTETEEPGQPGGPGEPGEEGPDENAGERGPGERGRGNGGREGGPGNQGRGQ